MNWEIVFLIQGSEPLNESKLVAKQHNEAQQDLQSLSIHKFPSDRLRYSKLLLTIYTLFGVDSILVESGLVAELLPHGNVVCLRPLLNVLHSCDWLFVSLPSIVFLHTLADIFICFWILDGLNIGSELNG